MDGAAQRRRQPFLQGALFMVKREAPKQCPAKDGVRNSPPSSLYRDSVDSDRYSMVSEAPSSHCHRRKWHGEKRLASACFDMLIFKLTDPNMDVTYILWRFDVQGWLDQYQEESMMPHIYNSLRGYPSHNSPCFINDRQWANCTLGWT